ncbi:hypothetical protein BAMA_22700, partial [Bacillus manliponensis]
MKPETLTLVLKIDGKDKRFVPPNFISGKLFRRAAEIADAFTNGSEDVAEFDNNFQFVCDVYGNQFDIEELEEGVDARKVFRTVFGVAQYILGHVEQASRLLAAENEEDGS